MKKKKKEEKNKVEESPLKKSRRRAFINKAKKVVAIFAALAFDKHLDYDQDEGANRENRKEKE